MKEDYQVTVTNLKKKIEMLISAYEQVVADNRILSAELEKFKYALEQSTNREKESETKLNNLQLIEAFKASSTDVREAKQKIARLVKEIDKCIALLND
jgi:regulator of replication initiation timing